MQAYRWELMVRKKKSKRLTGVERRQSKRLPVVWSGRLSVEDSETDCVLLNVSAHGALLRLTDPLEQQDTINLNIQRFGDIVGEVVWHHQERVGFRFRMPAKTVAHMFKGTLPDFHLA